MTTPHKHAELIHAFADGKTLQCKTVNHDWLDWTIASCPSFDEPTREWRIKPDEPKKIVYHCYAIEGQLIWISDTSLCRINGSYKPRPELDREVTLPEGE